ncbi:MAG: hypothetical protein Fur0011_5940 [Candidatus Microgenomates bacterium]
MLINIFKGRIPKKTEKKENIELSWLKNLEKWNRDWGDVSRRINYNLNEKSIVFDIGGYKGQWASDIYAKYHCTLYIFEPIKKYASFIKKRFSSHNNIHVLSMGASIKNHSRFLYIDNEKSSTNIESEAAKSKRTKVKMIDLCKYIKDNNIKHIDLMKINIEGDEYDLLNKIISTETVKCIDNLQVQFHRFIDDSVNKRRKIRKLLRKTHKQTYNYPFIWENWEIKNAGKNV